MQIKDQNHFFKKLTRIFSRVHDVRLFIRFDYRRVQRLFRRSSTRRLKSGLKDVEFCPSSPGARDNDCWTEYLLCAHSVPPKNCGYPHTRLGLLHHLHCVMLESMRRDCFCWDTKPATFFHRCLRETHPNVKCLAQEEKCSWCLQSKHFCLFEAFLT